MRNQKYKPDSNTTLPQSDHTHRPALTTGLAVYRPFPVEYRKHSRLAKKYLHTIENVYRGELDGCHQFGQKKGRKNVRPADRMEVFGRRRRMIRGSIGGHNSY